MRAGVEQHCARIGGGGGLRHRIGAKVPKVAGDGAFVGIDRGAGQVGHDVAGVIEQGHVHVGHVGDDHRVAPDVGAAGIADGKLHQVAARLGEGEVRLGLIGCRDGHTVVGEDLPLVRNVRWPGEVGGAEGKRHAAIGVAELGVGEGILEDFEGLGDGARAAGSIGGRQGDIVNARTGVGVGRKFGGAGVIDSG